MRGRGGGGVRDRLMTSTGLGSSAQKLFLVLKAQCTVDKWRYLDVAKAAGFNLPAGLEGGNVSRRASAASVL